MPRHGLGTGFVVAAAQAQDKDLEEQASIGGPGDLELMIRREGHLSVLRRVPQPGIPDRELLVRHVDEAPLMAPPDDAGLPAGLAIAFARQGDDLLIQDLGHGLGAQRNERLNQRHLTVETLGSRHRRHGPMADLFQLALFAHSEYSGHRSGSFLSPGVDGGCLDNDHCTTPELPR